MPPVVDRKDQVQLRKFLRTPFVLNLDAIATLSDPVPHCPETCTTPSNCSGQWHLRLNALLNGEGRKEKNEFDESGPAICTSFPCCKDAWHACEKTAHPRHTLKSSSENMDRQPIADSLSSF